MGVTADSADHSEKLQLPAKKWLRKRGRSRVEASPSPVRVCSSYTLSTLRSLRVHPLGAVIVARGRLLPRPTSTHDPPDIRINVFYHQTNTAKTARREQPAAEGPRGRSVAKEARGVAKPEAQRLDARVQNIGRR